MTRDHKYIGPAKFISGRGTTKNRLAKAERNSILDINTSFSLNRKEARDSYNEKFGLRFDDPSLDDEFERIFQDAISQGKDSVAVPTKLALAFVIRPRGRGKGRKHPPKERAAARIERSAVSQANRRWAELVNERPTTSKHAKHQAATEAQATFGRLARVGVETIKHKMNLKEGQTALKRR